jgi:hypothetical protein
MGLLPASIDSACAVEPALRGDALIDFAGAFVVSGTWSMRAERYDSGCRLYWITEN